MGILFFNTGLAKADVIVAFEGRKGRVRAAYELVKEGYAQTVIISPASIGRLDAYDRQLKPDKQFEKIIEKKARTTFENVLFTKRLLQAHKCESIILVTSWDHVPRSYLLLKAMLCFSGVRVQRYFVPTGKLSTENWYLYSAGWKMVYNEMLETWGSLIEVARYHIHGRLPAEYSGDAGLLGALKKMMLFDVQQNELEIN